MKFHRKLNLVNGLLAAACLLVGPGTALADVESFAEEKMATEARAEIGYRGFSLHGEPGRAAEFTSLKSSPVFDGRVFTDQEGYHLDLGLNYLNDEDFSGDAHLETKGLLRLDVRSERFMHNLDHIPYANGFQGHPTTRSESRTTVGPFVEGSRPDDKIIYGTQATDPSTRQLYYNDQNVNDDYALRLGFTEVKAKIKCPDYPAHLTMSYWRYDKEGERQQRFLDHGDRATSTNSCTGCHMQSKTRDINLVTEEFKIGTDAHAGFIDVAVEALYRKFSDQGATPQDSFRFPSDGIFPHDEYPDSTLKELTFKLNTAPSGGLVGSTSFTIGKRENDSGLDSEYPIEAETDYRKASADLTYTPDQNWTFSLRYRLLDMDSDNTDALVLVGGQPQDPPATVRQSMDVTRNWYEGLVNYRPWKWLTLKGEVRFEEIDRSNTGDALDEWELPDNEEITRIKLGFNSRFLSRSALKVNGWLAFQHNEDPAYGTTPEDSTEFYLTGTYAPTAKWGVTTSLNLLHESRDDHDVVQVDTTPNPDVDVFYNDLERKRDQQNFMLGGWVVLTDGLSLDLNYGYLRTRIEQDLLFGTDPGSPSGGSTDYTTRNDDVDYDQTVQTVSIGATWQALESLACRLEGYHIRSKGSYDPEFYRTGINYGGPAANLLISSSDLHDISKVDIAQNGLKGRVDWTLSENLTCGLEATFDDYDEKGNDIYDGSVQSYLASLTYTF